MDEQSFFAASFESGGLSFISPKNAWPLLHQGVLLIDLRPDFEGEYKRPLVPGLVVIPYSELPGRVGELSVDSFLILADCVGIRSKEIMKLLKGMGFTRMLSLAGGFVDWERDGFPIQLDPGKVLTGSCMCQLKARGDKQKFG
ncbi:MAG: rhodanese-like domain-containing protein [Bacteroidales bacterium]|nr:rhodanese-like domain-containing protein [Bacteroidales bacterium]